MIGRLVKLSTQLISRYASIIAFYEDLKSLEQFAKEEKDYKEIVSFYIKAYILRNIIEMENSGIEPSFNNVRSFIESESTLGEYAIDLELKLIKILPKMQQEDLLDNKLNTTKLGRQVIDYVDLALSREREVILKVDQ